MSDIPLAPLTARQQRFAEEGLPLVHELARVYHRQWRSIPESDFISVGHVAVVKAARQYDPKRRTPFEIFLRPGLSGAMLKLAKRERYIVQRVTGQVNRLLLERPLHDMTTTEMLDVSTRSIDDDVRDLSEQAADLVATTVSAGTKQLSTDEDGVVEGIDRRALFERMRSALRDLSAPERQFAYWYYEEALSVGDVVRKLGIERHAVFRTQKRVREKLAHALATEVSDEAGRRGAAGDTSPRTARAAPSPSAGREEPPPSKRGRPRTRRAKPSPEGS